MPTTDEAASIDRAIRVLRTWAAGQQDNLPVAMQEAQLIAKEDGSPEPLLGGLISVAGFLLVALEQHGQSDHVTFAMLEAFQRSVEAAE